MKKNNYIDLGERGRLNLNNKLNDLTGKEWIKFTKSWFIHRPPRRKNDEILHPAKFPESLVAEFISFFTKENEWVFDPFLGTGSTLIAASLFGRNGAGIELNNKYYKIAKERITNENSSNKLIAIKGNSLNLNELLNKVLKEKEKSTGNKYFDFILTSPPYWNQLKRNGLRQKSRKENGLDTQYSSNKTDLGNIEEYNDFIKLQAEIFDSVFDITKPGGYLTIITNNVYSNGKLFPLAFDTAVSLTNRGNKSWVLKDEKIWLQDDKPLIALGVNNSWVSNRHHQYCLIFRKENE